MKKLDLKKFPHLTDLHEEIIKYELLVGKLKIRKQLIQQKCLDTKAEAYDRNEAEILSVKTDLELRKLYNSVLQKKEHFKNLSGITQECVDDMDKNYDTLVSEAREVQSENEKVAEIISEGRWEEIPTNMEAKIDIYLKLKEVLRPKEEPKSHLSVVE